MKVLTTVHDWMRLEAGMRTTLPQFLMSQRWFGGKTRSIRSVDFVDAIPIPVAAGSACIFLLRVEYHEGKPETYIIPLFEYNDGDQEKQNAETGPTFQVHTENGEQHLFSDALWNQAFLEFLLEALVQRKSFSGANGKLMALPTRSLESSLRTANGLLGPSRMKAEQSNSSVLYGRSLVLKFFRRLERGINPDYEIGEFLSQRAEFSHVPAVAGVLEYREQAAPTSTLGILQTFVANQGDAWQQTLKALAEYFDKAEPRGTQILKEENLRHPSLLSGLATPPSSLQSELLGDYRKMAYLLGQRTAELHMALASDRQDPDFAPEPFSRSYQQELCESMSNLTAEALTMLRGRAAELPAELQEKANSVLSLEDRILNQFRLLRERSLTGLRTRVHGDFHLGQVLCTDGDFMFIDFEGEPVRTLAERRKKHSPLRDVAGMLRSFHYAAYGALFDRIKESSGIGPGRKDLWPLADLWYRWVATEYLHGYVATASRANFLPSEDQEMTWLLNILLLEKAVYELKYELSHRLSWVRIPLEGILDVCIHDVTWLC